jgi:septal ring factor EnvC (AmiA/AmiB activator)
MSWVRRELVCVVLVALGLTMTAWQAAAQQAEPGFDPNSALVDARVEERSILGQLAMIDGELEQVLSETLDLRRQLEELEERRSTHVAAVQESDERLQSLAGGVQAQIRALYRIYRQGLAQVLFGAEDPRELRRRGRYLAGLVRADAGRFREYEKIRDKRKAALDKLDADRGRLDELRTKLELKETELRDQRAARMDLLQKVRKRRELALQVMGEWDRARSQFDTMLDARTAPAAARQARSQPTDAWAGGMGISRSAVPTSPSSANTFRESFGRLPWPVRGRLVRRYGLSTDPATGHRTTHNGIDVASEFAEPVRAVYRGIVRMAGPVRGLGQTVAVQHGPYTTVYAHLSGVRVRVDDTVVAGQVIGLVGNTGLTAADGYRLTFEVRYNNSPQDPLPWLTR